MKKSARYATIILNSAQLNKTPINVGVFESQNSKDTKDYSGINKMEDYNADAPQKEYTGVWIPYEVMECDELEPLDKLVYGEIASFRECYASNAWIAKRVKRSEKTASRSIQRLIELGFVKNCGFNGRFRIIRVDKYVQADRTNMSMQHGQICPTENKVKNKVYTSTIVDGADADEGDVQKSEYGNHEVNALLELWEHETGITANVAKANRIAAYNLLRRRGFDGAKAVIELCGRAIKSGDPYAPRVSSFRDLQGKYEKLSKLEAWEARNNPPVEEGITMDYYTHDTVEYTEPTDEQWERTRELMKEARKNLPFLQKKGGKK